MGWLGSGHTSEPAAGQIGGLTMSEGLETAWGGKFREHSEHRSDKGPL